MRYSDKEGHVAVDDFIAAYIKLKSLFGWSIVSAVRAVISVDFHHHHHHHHHHHIYLDLSAAAPTQAGLRS